MRSLILGFIVFALATPVLAQGLDGACQVEQRQIRMVSGDRDAYLKATASLQQQLLEAQQEIVRLKSEIEKAKVEKEAPKG